MTFRQWSVERSSRSIARVGTSDRFSNSSGSGCRADPWQREPGSRRLNSLRQRRLGRALTAPLTVFVVACSAPSASDCPSIQRHSISVEVTDSATNAFVAVGARIVARHNGIADTVVAPGRPGTADESGRVGIGFDVGLYDVSVAKQGYRDWAQHGIVVSRNSCGQPDTQIITALLQRL